MEPRSRGTSVLGSISISPLYPAYAILSVSHGQQLLSTSVYSVDEESEHSLLIGWSAYCLIGVVVLYLKSVHVQISQQIFDVSRTMWSLAVHRGPNRSRTAVALCEFACEVLNWGLLLALEV